MKLIYAFSIIAIFSLTLSAVPCLSEDFLYVVLQWPGSSCAANEGCCYSENTKPAKNFVIAGLWPAFNNGMDSPQFCIHNMDFNKTENPNLTKSLDTHWPSLFCPGIDGSKLRAAEWRQYGSCSDLSLNQYFSTAITYKKKANIIKALASAGIKPNGKQYNTADILEAIEVKVGKTPELLCNKDKSGKLQLYQVVFCGQANKLIDCTGLPKENTCSGLVKFPSF